MDPDHPSPSNSATAVKHATALGIHFRGQSLALITASIRSHDHESYNRRRAALEDVRTPHKSPQVVFKLCLN